MNLITDLAPDAMPTALQREVEAALARRPPSLHLPPELRHRYEVWQALPRALAWRRAALIGSAVYVIAVLILNPIAVLRPNWMDMALQISVTPTVALLTASLFCRPDMSAFAREWAGTVIACCFCLTTVLAVVDSPSEGPQTGFVLACLPVAYVLLFVPLRFPGAVAFMAFSVMTLTCALLLRHDVPPAQSIAASSAMLIISVPVLVIIYLDRLRARRRDLRRMLHELRAEAATPR